jgi:hypothetical protein
MKETVILMMVIAFCYSCTTENSKSNNNIQVSKGSAQNISKEKNSLTKLKRDSIQPTKIVGDKSLSFKFDIDSSGSLLKTINVYSENILIQKITANKCFESNKFELIDWNFDGAKDITVLYNCGSGGCAYWIWNFSPLTNKFIFNKELSEVLGLERDTADQFIVFHYRTGYSEELWDSFKYVNNKLQFVKGRYRERWNDSLGNSWVKNTYSKMVNNVLVTNVDSSISK